MESKLFTPMRIGNVEIKNRLIMSSMNSKLTKNHLYLPDGIAYYAERAKGGFGLLITEFLAIEEDGLGGRNEPLIWDDSCLEPFRRLTATVHENGSKIFAQLHHAGMIAIQNDRVKPKGPSLVNLPECPAHLHVLTMEDIKELVQKYAAAALRAKKAGFDGVEIHSAHGYLPIQFLSRATNKRTDAYGGGYENRFRFLGQVIAAIKEAAGKDYPLSVRISALEKVSDGMRLGDACIFAKMIEQAGADCINVSIGGTGSLSPIQSYFQEEGFNLPLSREIKKQVSLPVIISGRITQEQTVVSIIENADADFVALGRQSLCDPYFPNKIREGNQELIMHCTGCMQRCTGDGKCEETDTGISCMLRPFSGKEGRWIIRPLQKPLHIAVIGSGPAGLQAAWILAKRGAKVDLYERAGQPGGTLRYVCIPHGKGSFGQAIQTLTAKCQAYGVSIHLNTPIHKDSALLKDKDTLILATGAKPLVLPSLEGLAKYAVFAQDVLMGTKLFRNRRVLILGAGSVGLETAETLTDNGNLVTLLDMAPEPAADMVKIIRTQMLASLDEHHTAFVLQAFVKQVFADGVRYEQNGEIKELRGFDQVINALGYKADSALAEALSKQKKTYVIGDAKTPRNVMYAIYEATKLALEMENEHENNRTI